MEKRCKKCTGELYVEAPPFEEMSDQDKTDCKNQGGRVMLVCKECGEEDEETKLKKEEKLR